MHNRYITYAMLNQTHSTQCFLFSCGGPSNWFAPQCVARLYLTHTLQPPCVTQLHSTSAWRSIPFGFRSDKMSSRRSIVWRSLCTSVPHEWGCWIALATHNAERGAIDSYHMLCTHSMCVWMKVNACVQSQVFVIRKIDPLRTISVALEFGIIYRWICSGVVWYLIFASFSYICWVRRMLNSNYSIALPDRGFPQHNTTDATNIVAIIFA